MNINTIILRNLKKNLKHYYLYVFALVFSVALYFAFVTLQYDPSMSEAKGSIKGAAAIKTASILLVAIVSIFLLYANTIFIKRRSKEIGLFQLIGMTKNEIFRSSQHGKSDPLFWLHNHWDLYRLFGFEINTYDFI